MRVSLTSQPGQLCSTSDYADWLTGSLMTGLTATRKHSREMQIFLLKKCNIFHTVSWHLVAPGQILTLYHAKLELWLSSELPATGK